MSASRHASLRSLGFLVLALSAAPLIAESPVVMMTSQQDHDRQMRELKISGFPPGPDPYQAATYDEATATPYPTLPDPLVMRNGQRVTSLDLPATGLQTLNPLTLPLRAGTNTIQLVSENPPIPASVDNRPLAISVANLTASVAGTGTSCDFHP